MKISSKIIPLYFPLANLVTSFRQIVSQLLRSHLCMLAQSKIRQLDMSVDIQQHIIWFEIAMNIF